MCFSSSLSLSARSLFFRKVLIKEAGDKLDMNAACDTLDGATALHLAVKAASEESVALLLAAGADRSARDAHRHTPSDLASALAAKTDARTPEGTTKLARFFAGARWKRWKGRRREKQRETERDI